MACALNPKGAVAEGSLSETGFPVNWEDFDLQDVTVKNPHMFGFTQAKILKDTSLCCTLDGAVKSWKTRQMFIARVAQDVIANCPKEEPVALISLGSDRLLMEYILGRILMENGFSHLFFFMVDPMYCFAPKEEFPVIKNVLQDFKKKIEEIFSRVFKTPFSADRVRFLPRAQHVFPHLQTHFNVVLIEAIPPYTRPLQEMEEHDIKQTPENLMLAGYIVPAAFANTLTIIPKEDVEEYKKWGATLKTTFPISIYHNPHTSKRSFCIDWGCKIYSNGTYILSFSGKEGFIEKICRSLPSGKIRLKSGEKINKDKWISTTEQEVDTALRLEIDPLLKKSQRLTQKDITTLLQKVQEVVEKSMPDINQFFYCADYTTDEIEMIQLFPSSEDRHYRRIFTLGAGVGSEIKVTIEEIVPL